MGMEKPAIYTVPPERAWLFHLDSSLSVLLTETRLLSNFNLMSPCCTAWLDWHPTHLTCGKCKEQAWDRLDPINPARTHYCPIESPLVVTWCELQFDPLEAELVADALRRQARKLLELRHD